MKRMQLHRWIASLVVALLAGGCGDKSGEDANLKKRAYNEDFSTEGLVWIPGGQFTMGSDSGKNDERPPHVVKLSGFWIGKYEVTNEEFGQFVKLKKYVTIAEKQPTFEELFAHEIRTLNQEKVAELRAKYAKDHMYQDRVIKPGSLVFSPPDRDIPINILRNHGVFMNWWKYLDGASWKMPQGPDGVKAEDHPQLPVVHVSWFDAVAYCKWKTEVTGVVHRLPTEAEWEFAARGGLKEKEYIWGDEQRPTGKHMANIWQGRFPRENTKADGFELTAPVGKYPANGYGLHDMAGNVWEWCSDWFRPNYYSESPVNNPQGPTVERSFDPNDGPNNRIPKRVQRGGSFLCTDLYCGAFRPSRRMKNSPESGASHSGFRIVVEAPAPKE